MTENTTNHTIHDDFEARMHDSYEQIELTPEAEERMLANIQAYQTKVQGERETRGNHNAMGQTTTYTQQTAAARSLGNAHVEHTQHSPHQPAAKRRVIPWKVVLPAAACLLLVLGVGALIATNEDGTLPGINPTAAPVSSDSSNTASAEKGTSPAETLSNQNAVESMMATEAYEADASWSMPYDPGAYNTEEYNAVDEPGFVSTATRPLSTFGADCDTASYANLRRLINQGYGIRNVYDEWTVLDGNGLAEESEDMATEDAEGYYEYDSNYAFDYESMTIPKGAIRIEEMLNYFTYDYALPEGNNLFGTTVHLGDCPWNPDTKLLVMGFATNPDAGTATKGSNLVFLIDTSGSMNEPDKMDLLQDAFAELTGQLDNADRISIVTYSGYEEVVLDGASGSDARTIQRAIDRLRPEGSTNGEAGLKMAYEVAEKNFIEGGVNRIILASDGDLNVGMSSESDLHDFVESKRDTGIYLSVLGFGAGNYKDNKMETLADAGNGNYHYIDCLEEAEKVFGKDLVANLVPLANDVKFQVEFNPAQVKGYRLIGYENRALADEDFRDDTKDAGDVGPGHQLTVAYEIVPVDSKMEIAESELKYREDVHADSRADSGAAIASNADTASSEWLTCTMRYTPVQKADGDGFVVEASDAREQSVVVNGANLQADPGNDWRFAAAVAEFGMVMRDSEYKGTATFDTIEDLLDACDLSNAERKDFQRLVRKAR